MGVDPEAGHSERIKRRARSFAVKRRGPTGNAVRGRHLEAAASTPEKRTVWKRGAGMPYVGVRVNGDDSRTLEVAEDASAAPACCLPRERSEATYWPSADAARSNAH
jgi:hypothetical protein